MQVMVDGRPVYSPFIGGVFWTDLALDIDDVARIEVIRGPNAAAYGANSFLGAINIVTLDPREVEGTDVHVLRGNHQTRKGLLRHGGRLGHLRYRLSLVHREDDGFDNRFDGMRLSLANFHAIYNPRPDTDLELLLGYNGGPRQEGSATDHPDTRRDRDLAYSFQQIVWRHRGGPGDETRIQLYHNFNKNKEDVQTPLLSQLFGVPPALVALKFPGEQDTRLLIPFGSMEERFEGEIQQRLQAGDRLRLVLGGSFRLDRVRARGWLNREDTVDNHLGRLFGQAEWHPRDRLVVNLSTMVEDSDLVGTRVSPRLAVNYQWRRLHGLRASVSRATRLPTLFEHAVDAALRFPDGTPIDYTHFGNPHLKPERLTSFEVGYLGKWPGRHLTLDLKAFHDKLEDRITTVKDEDFMGRGEKANVFTNSGKVNLNGAEMALSWRPATHTMVSFNYAYAKGKGWALDAIHDPGVMGGIKTEDLQEDIPTHTRSLFVMHRLDSGLELSATYYRVSAMKWLGDGDPLGPQERLDARIAQTLHLGGSRLDIALVGQNLTATYEEFRHINRFDTRVHLEIALSLD